jgi:hypothetical protein
MGVELRERKWCGVLRIEKVGVEGCWMLFSIVHGLIVYTYQSFYNVSGDKKICCSLIDIFPFRVIYVCVCLTTIIVERVFSTMNIIKNLTRNLKRTIMKYIFFGNNYDVYLCFQN